MQSLSSIPMIDISRAELRTFLRAKLDVALRLMIADPSVQWDIQSVDIIQGRSYDYGSELLHVRLHVVSNDRSAIIGRDALVPFGGLAGFTKQYCLGFLDGALAERFGIDAASRIVLYIDVHDTPACHSLQSHSSSMPLHTYMELEFAISHALVDPTSPLVTAMRHYNLTYLLFSGGVIAGPCLPMLEAVSRVTRRYRVRTVLDLFSGTGSLAAIAIRTARRIVCVDVDTSVLSHSLYSHTAELALINTDARTYIPDASYDLAILDPYYEHALDILPGVLEHIAPWCSMILVNGGPSAEQYWSSRVRAMLNAHAPEVLLVRRRQHDVYLCLLDNHGGAPAQPHTLLNEERMV